MIVDIRFNTNFPTKSQYEWRVLVDGQETLVNDVKCFCPTYTTSSFIEGAGMKWHMSANAKSVDFQSTENKKIAHIK